MGGRRGAQRLDEGLRISERLGDLLARGLIVNARGWLERSCATTRGHWSSAMRPSRWPTRRRVRCGSVGPRAHRPSSARGEAARAPRARSFHGGSDGRGRAELRRCGCVGMGAATDGWRCWGPRRGLALGRPHFRRSELRPARPICTRGSPIRIGRAWRWRSPSSCSTRCASWSRESGIRDVGADVHHALAACAGARGDLVGAAALLAAGLEIAGSDGFRGVADGAGTV